MKTYQEIFDDYENKYYRDKEDNYQLYSEVGSLRDAIEKAFKSENLQKKIHSHQRRIGRKLLAEAGEIALKYFDNMSKEDFDSFDKIHQFVKSVADKVKGFGSLATYDVAVRIAKYKRCSITEVHLHAGTTKGARAMGFDVKDGDAISIDKFPAPFNRLDGDHLENLLCIYKDVLAGISNQPDRTCS